MPTEAAIRPAAAGADDSVIAAFPRVHRPPARSAEDQLENG